MLHGRLEGLAIGEVRGWKVGGGNGKRNECGKWWVRSVTTEDMTNRGFQEYVRKSTYCRQITFAYETLLDRCFINRCVMRGKGVEVDKVGRERRWSGVRGGNER